jgi:hypothetical protein
LSSGAFKPSDTDPAVLSLQAGALGGTNGDDIKPVSRLSILLYDATNHYLGVMAELRDLLPGAYSFGITGRGPRSVRLKPGSYELRLEAWPTLSGKPSRVKVRFQIE